MPGLFREVSPRNIKGIFGSNILAFFWGEVVVLGVVNVSTFKETGY